MYRAACLFRTQLVSLRSFLSPGRLACGGHVARAPAVQAGSPGHQLRCYAAISGQPDADLSVNAVKRRADELAARLGDVVKVGCAAGSSVISRVHHHRVLQHLQAGWNWQRRLRVQCAAPSTVQLCLWCGMCGRRSRTALSRVRSPAH